MNCTTMYKVIEKTPTSLSNFSLCELQPVGSERILSHPVNHNFDFKVGDTIICEPNGNVIKLTAIKKEGTIKNVLGLMECGKKYRYLIKESDNLSLFNYCIVDSNYYFNINEKISGFLFLNKESSYPEFILRLYLDQENKNVLIKNFNNESEYPESEYPEFDLRFYVDKKWRNKK